MQSFRRSFLPRMAGVGVRLAPLIWAFHGAGPGRRRRRWRPPCVAAMAVAWPAAAAERPVRIVALGDSLTAGVGLPAARRSRPGSKRRSRAKGLAVEIANAGVSGDTASGGLARLDWSVPEGTDAVIVELGANDMLRGIDPKVTRRGARGDRAAADRAAHCRCCSPACGRRPISAPTTCANSKRSIPIWPANYDLLFYPFFLDGVAAEAKFNQRDGLHPTAAGIDRIVAGILPKAEELVARVRDRRATTDAECANCGRRPICDEI